MKTKQQLVLICVVALASSRSGGTEIIKCGKGREGELSSAIERTGLGTTCERAIANAVAQLGLGAIT